MNAREFIYELLCELGESDLARRVQSKLLKNEEAGLLLRFADSGTPREVNVQFNQIMCEME
jgi:hypothetical protein